MGLSDFFKDVLPVALIGAATGGLGAGLVGTIGGRMAGALGANMLAGRISPVGNQPTLRMPATPFLSSQVSALPAGLASLYAGGTGGLPEGYEADMGRRLQQFQESMDFQLAKSKRSLLGDLASRGLTQSTETAQGLGELYAGYQQSMAQYGAGLQSQIAQLQQSMYGQGLQAMTNIYGSQLGYAQQAQAQQVQLYGMQVDAALRAQGLGQSAYQYSVQQNQALAGALRGLISGGGW